jgi:hypothetical protein
LFSLAGSSANGSAALAHARRPKYSEIFKVTTEAHISEPLKRNFPEHDDASDTPLEKAATVIACVASFSRGYRTAYPYWKWNDCTKNYFT